MHQMKVYFSSAQVDLEQLEALKKVGFRGWEVIAEGLQELGGETISLINYLKSSYDLEISVHTPFSDLNIASLNGLIWDETFKQTKGAIEAVANYASIFVIHPAYLSPLAALCPDKALQKKNKEALCELTQFARECGVTATIENMVDEEFLLGRFPGEVEDTHVDGLGFTFDVGHANTANAIDAFMRMPVDHVHLHDDNGQTDEHLVLGLGNINWSRVMRGLTRYRGVFVLESRTLNGGVQSLRYLQRFTV
jgi:sugar phosphate isomerase/epimerase